MDVFLPLSDLLKAGGLATELERRAARQKEERERAEREERERPERERREREEREREEREREELEREEREVNSLDLISKSHYNTLFNLFFALIHNIS